MKKWMFVIIGYLLLFYFFYVYHIEILAWIEHSDTKQLPWMFLISTFLSIIPVIPFTLFAGIMGAKYGLIIGALINWFGSVAAAIIIFLVARYMFNISIEVYLKKSKRIISFHRLIKENAFIAILFSRLIPIVPPPVVTIYSGISKIRIRTYTIATMLGKIPGMFLYAYIGNQLFASFEKLMIGILCYVIFIASIVIIYKKWSQNKRAQGFN
ncbi:TVP38/TMEM64 family protein [Litchfieldia alkalitelluris]|uniref:TVP38/TMEM64 family protein n=1 Tax=Litchfieldia alkalitelluris TaxID=304268 RepID=UPI000998B659|nr:VTT domain-containing protein [Litchfieldia alkalitelluris]